AGAAQDEPAGPARVVGGALRIRPLPGWAASEPPGAPLPELVLPGGGGALALGLPALRFGHNGIADGVSIEGVATVAVVTTTGAVFDAFAPNGDLAWAASDLDTMIDGAEVG